MAGTSANDGKTPIIVVRGNRAYVVTHQTTQDSGLYSTTTDLAIIDITSGDVLTDESFSEDGTFSNASLDVLKSLL